MNHEETIKRIQELTGGMALEFGCEVILLNTKEDTYEDERGAVCIEVGEDVFDSYPDGEYHLQEKLKYEVYFLNETWGDCEQTLDSRTNNSCQFIVSKILGKPITLAVIFQAIHATMISPEKQEKSHHLIDYSVEAEGGVYPPLWNLSRDNFNDQSEETKSFIRGLLGN